MDTIIAYLTRLQNQVFKLLPMREAYDLGEDNHLYEYVDNLYSNYRGAFTCFPELRENEALIEAQNNIAFLKNAEEGVTFEKWRSMVLRSTRLIHSVLDEYAEV